MDNIDDFDIDFDIDFDDSDFDDANFDDSDFDDFFALLDDLDFEYAEKRKPYINALIEELNISEEQASSFVYSAKEIAYSPSEFALVVKYYCDVFNGYENLCSFVENQSYVGINMDERKNTLFTKKPYTIFGNRIHFLQHFFEIDKDTCISLIIANPSWLYHKENYFVDKTNALMSMFSLEKKALVSLYHKHPFILGKRLNRLTNLIKNISTYYNIPENKVKELMINRPFLMNKGMSFYVQNKLGKEIFDKQWILSCLTDYEPCCFGGYRTFENLRLVINKIETDIGKIINIYKKCYRDSSFIVLLIERNNQHYLVSLGADAIIKEQRIRMLKDPTQELLERIFGDLVKITNNKEYLSPRNEYICLLNTDNEKTINDILLTMSFVAIAKSRSEVELKYENLSYLTNSNDIGKCSIDEITPLKIKEHNLTVLFYKIEPTGNKKLLISSLMPSTLKDPFDDSLNNF